MSLNWNTFPYGDGLTLSSEQWSDILPTNDATLQMPKSNPTRSSTSDAEEPTTYESFLNGNPAGPYFEENLFAPNDYCLSDIELLQPFGDMIAGGGSTSESSPEPATNMSPTDYQQNSDASPNVASTSSMSNQSPPLLAKQRQALLRAKSFPNPSYESMFPNNIESGFVEDLTFPGGPGPLNSSKPSAESNTSGNTTTKRSKADSDILSACWTSPLCPNHDLNGEIPNSANCSGGCAPFLFASEDTLPTPTVNSFPVRVQEVIAEDGVVEIQPRTRKRADSNTSSNEPQGRQFPIKNSTETEPRVKSEKPSASPEQFKPQANEDAKPKSRRRLPHNQVERKYRESLNTQLDSLLRVVPSLQQNQPSCEGGDIEDLPAPAKPSKAIILASATAYIKQMEKDKKSLADENMLLKKRVMALQALIKCDDCSLMKYVMDLKINPQN